MKRKRVVTKFLIAFISVIAVVIIVLLADNVAKQGSEEKNVANEKLVTSTPSPTEDVKTEEKRVVAYYASWAAYDRKILISDITPEYITHLNFAFANLTYDGEIIVGDPKVDLYMNFSDDYEYEGDVAGHFGEMIKLKKEYPTLKTLISVGGWSWSENFSEVASNTEKRKVMVDSAIDFITDYGFDGIDIDWEFPVAGGPHDDHRPEDKENFTLLLKEMREALDELEQKSQKQYLLTIATGVEKGAIDNLEVEQIMNYVDFVNLMTYNYHGSWEKWTNHNAPLYHNGASKTSDQDFCIEETLNSYLSKGAVPEKLNLGIPFYGYAWYGVSDQGESFGLFEEGQPTDSEGNRLGTYTGGELEYWDIAKNYVNQNGYVRYFDNISKAPYLYNGNIFITYEDCSSLEEKISYVERMHLGGLMFWEFSQDREKELQSFIYNRYLACSFESEQFPNNE